MSNQMQQRIRELREEAGLTPEQMAERLGCAQRVYCGYELGSRVVPLKVLYCLADMHATSVDYLLGRTNKREFVPMKRPRFK